MINGIAREISKRLTEETSKEQRYAEIFGRLLAEIEGDNPGPELTSKEVAELQKQLPPGYFERIVECLLKEELQKPSQGVR